MRNNATRASGRKPTVAYNAEAKAKVNIETKLNLIERFVKQCAVMSPPEGWSESKRSNSPPQSLRQFNRWTDTSFICSFLNVEKIEVQTIGNGTLERYAELRVRVQRALENIEKLKSKGGTLLEQSEATRRRAHKRALRQLDILERELVDLRRERFALIQERDELKNQLYALQKRFRDEVSKAVESKTAVKGAVVTRLK
ncbi:hypothetical protein PPMP20_08985 [Paraburkholderia phymatum]|uniref:Uncharacterized protein n=1 Tax=Paraburkholderia phymatum (strain DSM 17167 / CIP 108236 / LMG 21445 / STM815) TaxID=391038 RepID=B2JC62_PARP8|nr:hypothetical protein [Paraburkholderia phymatum]ACC69426.1 hypothetical protein Bphy_0233 [Paraburkholderia phymatum STM815]